MTALQVTRMRVEHRLASQMVGLDLVTHCSRPFRRRRFAQGPSATSGPAAAGPALLPPPARFATPARSEAGETTPAEACDNDGAAFSSASPSNREERGSASITIPSVAADNNSLSRRKAAQSTIGLAARRKTKQAARSNINWGTSKLLAALSPVSRVQRKPAEPFLTNDSRINKARPYEGCQG